MEKVHQKTGKEKISKMLTLKGGIYSYLKVEKWGHRARNQPSHGTAGNDSIMSNTLLV